MISPGDRLDGKYCVVKRLGGGGFGEVFLADDESIPDRQVAIKVLKQPKGDDHSDLLHEMKALAKFHHPNVVTFYHHFQNQSGLHLVMEFCSGGSLYDRLKAAGSFPRRGSANHRHNAGADRFRQRRPRGHEHGQFGVGDAPFALRATTPGDLVRRKLLNRIGLGMRALRTHNPLVLGSNPSRPIVNARDTICRSAAQSDTRLLESRVPETTIREAMDLPAEAGANRAAR